MLGQRLRRWPSIEPMLSFKSIIGFLGSSAVYKSTRWTLRDKIQAHNQAQDQYQ